MREFNTYLKIAKNYIPMTIANGRDKAESDLYEANNRINDLLDIVKQKDEAIKILLTAFEKEKEKNKELEHQQQVEIEGRNILVGLNENLKEELKKEKEKNKELLENATVTYFNDEELKESVGNYLGVLLKKNIEKDYISKNKIREIIYPTPTNPISYEIQTSDMYKKILELLEEE